MERRATDMRILFISALVCFLLQVTPQSSLGSNEHDDQSFDSLGNCGARCLYVSLAARDVKLPSYKEFLENERWTRELDCSLADIEQSAAKYQTQCRLVRFDGSRLPEFTGQLIAHVSPNHFIVIGQRPDGRISWCDPPLRPRPITQSDLATLSGQGLLIGEASEKSAKTTTWIVALFVIGVMTTLVFRRVRGSYQ